MKLLTTAVIKAKHAHVTKYLGVDCLGNLSSYSGLKIECIYGSVYIYIYIYICIPTHQVWDPY